MIHVRELDHLVLRVRDLEAMVRWYGQVLGCREQRRVERIGLVQLRAGRSMIDLLAADDGPTGTARNLDHFCLRVEPFDEAAIRRHLQAHGVEAGPLAQRVGAEGDGPSIYVSDPEGNTVELKGPPGPAGGST